MINVPAILFNMRDKIPKSGEFSTSNIGCTKVHLFVAYNYEVCFVLCSVIRIVFHLVDLFGANWLDLQLPSFPEDDSCECGIEQDQCVLFFHGSFPVATLWAVNCLRVCEWIAVDGC